MTVQELIKPLEKNIIIEADVDVYQHIQYNINGFLLVINNKGQLIGIITDGDLRRMIASSVKRILASQIMNETPIVIKKNTLITEAMTLMKNHSINMLPIVDDYNVPIGYIELQQIVDKFSSERIYLKSELSENDKRHVARYKFALNFINTDTDVLDCACGSGYGSDIISKKVKSVLGIDISSEAIKHANCNYKRNGLSFIQSDIKDISLASNSYDAIVSLETLEHVSEEVCIDFLEKIVYAVKSKGVVFCSSPMLRYKDGVPYVTNPYHINEMPKQKFIDMIKKIFNNWSICFFHQDQETFLPLLDEHTGFCIVVARKK